MPEELDLFTDFEPYEEDYFLRCKENRETTPAPTYPAPPKKLMDFGKKIGGARKDMFAFWREKFIDYTIENIARQPFSITWPELPYDRLLSEGEEPGKIALLHALRTAFSHKPRKQWLIPKWAKAVHQMREVAMQLLEGMNYQPILSSVEEENEDIVFQAKLYERFGHHNNFDGFYMFYYNNYKWDNDSPNGAYCICDEKGKHIVDHIVAAGKTVEDALDNLALLRDYNAAKEQEKKAAEAEDPLIKHKKKYFVGYYTEDKNKNIWYVFRRKGKDGKTEKVSDSFSDSKTATSWMQDNWRSIEEQIQEKEQVLKAFRAEVNERSGENAPRIGPARRSGDVTPEMFMEAFGFYGVEFGNYVEGKARQTRLNETYDALMDLAEVLQFPHNAMSLGGELGLGFGSRGTGGRHAPVAHYEPGSRPVINLTKKNGAGSLAHEWFHALDNYLGKKAYLSTPRDHLTDLVFDFDHLGGLPEPVANAVCDLLTKCVASNFYQRSLCLCKSSGKKDYWIQKSEIGARCFEKYVKDKLEDLGIQNDFLVKFESPENWKEKFGKTLANEDGFAYPYPNDEEAKQFGVLFDQFSASVREHMPEMKFSAIGDTKELLQQSRILHADELNDSEISNMLMVKDGLGLNLAYIVGPEALHGHYDPLTNTVYVNRDCEMNPEWIFWHECFHALRWNNEEVYEDLMRHIERSDAFSSDQMNAYREHIQQPKLSDIRVKEEMLADAFADLKMRNKFMENTAKEEPSLAHNLIRYTQGMLFSFEQSSVLSLDQMQAFQSRISELSVQVDTIRFREGFAKHNNILKDNVVHFMPRKSETVKWIGDRCILCLQKIFQAHKEPVSL